MKDRLEKDTWNRIDHMRPQNCILVGAPVDSGKRRRGCNMGPEAYRTCGMAETLTELGHNVEG